jgi:hypothetical protein
MATWASIIEAAITAAPCRAPHVPRDTYVPILPPLGKAVTSPPAKTLEHPLGIERSPMAQPGGIPCATPPKARGRPVAVIAVTPRSNAPRRPRCESSLAARVGSGATAFASLPSEAEAHERDAAGARSRTRPPRSRSTPSSPFRRPCRLLSRGAPPTMLRGYGRRRRPARRDATVVQADPLLALGCSVTRAGSRRLSATDSARLGAAERFRRRAVGERDVAHRRG